MFPLRHQSSRGAALPAIIVFSPEQSRRELRASMIELGARLTGDAGRADLTFESAFMLA